MKVIRAVAPLLAPSLVVLAACAVYVNSIGNGFALDDTFIIEQNTRVRDLTAWRSIWLTPYWPVLGAELGLYRPFIIFLYAVQWAIGGGEPWVFHAGNVLLHAAATLLVFLLLEGLTARTPALVGALVFAVHPVHTEAVANVVGQAEVIAAIALLGACLVHISRPAGVAVSWPRRIALCALFAIAVMTKESAVILPGLLVALDFAHRRVRLNLRGFADYADAMLTPLLLLAATLAFYLILRFDALGGTLLGVDANPGLPFLRGEQRILNALRAFPEFLRLVFFPRNLSSDYEPAVIQPVDSLTPMVLLGAALLVASVALALLTPWRPAVGLPAAWFLFSIVTVSNLFFPIGVLVAERTLYLPSVALSIVLAYVSLEFAARAAHHVRRFAIGLLLVLLLLFSIHTWMRNPVWYSTQSVLTRLARDHPESHKAQWFQAAMAWHGERLDEAHFHFALAYRINPYDVVLMSSYAEFLQARGNHEAAVWLLEQSYARQRYVAYDALRLADAYIAVGRNSEALARIREAEKLGAPRPLSLVLRARAYQGLGDAGRSIGAWRVALATTTLHSSWLAWAFFARVLAMEGYDDEAAAALDSAGARADSAGRVTVERLGSAINNGCYGRRTAAAGSVGSASSVSPCDALGGDHVRLLHRQTENAMALHNASTFPLHRIGNTPGNVR